MLISIIFIILYFNTTTNPETTLLDLCMLAIRKPYSQKSEKTFR